MALRVALLRLPASVGRRIGRRLCTQPTGQNWSREQLHGTGKGASFVAHGNPHSLGSSSSATRGTINAYHLARTIDFISLAQTIFCGETHALQRDAVLISFGNGQAAKPEASSKYMVVFGYGSVVFFNVGEEEERVKQLNLLKGFCTGHIQPKIEQYGLIVQPTMENWVAIKHDYIQLQRLDLKNVRVISGVLGISVAMDYYDTVIEKMLLRFARMNAEIEQTGQSSMQKKDLFRWVAANNAILTDAVSRLRLLDRSETAWRYAEYSQVWEGMRGEFELEQRFSNMGYKLQLVHENTKFFLEVQQAQHSGRLEWIIIFLIAAEIVISLVEHSSDIKQWLVGDEDTKDEPGYVVQYPPYVTAPPPPP